MRILLGYTPEGLHPDTAAAVLPLGDAVEMVDVSGDDFAYWRAIRDRWDGTQDLVIIEQDNVIHDDVIPQFQACPGDWCLFPYPIFNSAQRLTQGLGCTRFSAALQRRVPCEGFATDGKLYGVDLTEEGVPWNFLDLIIAERLKLGHGLVPHLHEPDVGHRHDYGGPVTLGSEDGTGGRRLPADHPLAAYHRELPVIFSPQVLKPAVQVYGVTMTDVNSLDDAARLANSLAERYLNPDGTPRDTPAQLDTSRPPALHFATDKVEQGYLPTYLKIAGEIGTSGRVCEVGVWMGESLRMWQALFPGGIVAGVDNEEQSRWPVGTVKILASQEDETLPDQLRAISPSGWDIIVDDASHDGRLTRTCWELLWPVVRPGGWYVIEDWFVGYGSHPLFRGDHTMLDTARSFLELLDRRPMGRALSGQVESVTYQYGMILIRKTR